MHTHISHICAEANPVPANLLCPAPHPDSHAPRSRFVDMHVVRNVNQHLPVINETHLSETIESDVMTVDFLDCNGRLLKVDGLPEADAIEIRIPLKPGALEFTYGGTWGEPVNGTCTSATAKVFIGCSEAVGFNLTHECTTTGERCVGW